MKHYILVKFNPDGKARENLSGEIRDLFQRSLEIEGVHSVAFHTSIIDLPNRYDLMICVEMEKEALPLFDGSEIHAAWKKNFSGCLESKTIFDCE